VKKKIVIIGAGPVGLIAGWQLSKLGWEVEIFEKKKIVGGMCRSWKWKDFIVDTGPHIFHTYDKKLWEFWKKNFSEILLPGKFWAKSTIESNFHNYYDYPISEEGIKQFDQITKKKIYKELATIKKAPKVKSTNFSAHVEAQVGKTLRSFFFKDYPEKVWGISTDLMTAEWAPKRIKFRKKILDFFNGEYTCVGKYGTGSLYEFLKKEILNNGGKIHLNSSLTKVFQKDNKIVSLEFNNKKIYKIEESTTILSTLPITLISRFLGMNSNLTFRGVRCSYIAVNKKRVLPKNCNWIYFPSKKLIFNRLSEHKTFTKFVAPKDKTYLCIETTYSKGDEVDRALEKDFKKKILDDLFKTKLVQIKDVYGYSENKEDFVYPVQFINYKYELSKAETFLSKYKQLYSLGTGGEFNYADSQILFHKTFDLVENLSNKYAENYQTKRNKTKTKLNQHVYLGNKIVGNGQPVFIIAEAGLNHNGDIELAKNLIDQAKIVGADAIKFQTYLDERVSNKVKTINYAEKADGLQEDISEMFSRLSLSIRQHKEIFAYAKKKNLEIFSTPFDIKSVDFLEKLNVNFYKIASVDLVNLPLIEKVGRTGKPLILSTGMSDLTNVKEAVEKFKETGNKNLILLHCLSSYPANENEMNIRSIKTLKNNFNVPVGLSDHFPGIEIALMSIGLGANIIERHFTINKKFEGPDHILSSEPDELQKLINLAKNSEKILGDGEKVIQDSEYASINSQRKSIYAAQNLKKGQKLSMKNIKIKGPGGGILPKYLDLILSKKINSNISIDMPIKWENFFSE
jgi:sialic acid synthase SpsE/protoporphyrinogen oxidase